MEGMVIWGLHRDTADIRAIGLPVFSLGAIPLAPSGSTPARMTRWRPPSSRLGSERQDLVLGDDDASSSYPARRPRRSSRWRDDQRYRAGIRPNGSGRCLTAQPVQFRAYLRSARKRPP